MRRMNSVDSARAPAIPARSRLILLSFLMLFIELALIRWLGESVLYLSFFSNFVLLGSFLGIGIGFLRGDRGRPLLPYAPLLLFILVAFVTVFPVEVDRRSSDIIFFGELGSSGFPAWLMLPIIFLAVAATLAAVANGVARVFSHFEPLEAYRLDILGSLLGIVGFSVLSFLGSAPPVWGLVAAVVFLLVIGMNPVQLGVAIGMVAILGLPALTGDHIWSTYYDIEVGADQVQGADTIRVNVNGIPHQAIVQVEDRRRLTPVYFLPYEQAAAEQPPDEVLIVGAGTGSDVAVALSEGAGHVDAVEIDRALFELGADRHLDRPYDDPRVSVIIDDGRAYLERTDKLYDLVLFALPDSLTLVSGQSSLRLESFLFTEEALATVRDRLEPGGVFAMYNFYREDWLIDRLAGMMTSAFGNAPCVTRVGDVGGLAMLVVSTDGGIVDCSDGSFAPETSETAVNDDRPFLYLRTPTIPGFYLIAIALILIVSLVAVTRTSGSWHELSKYPDLFLMGVAFLLLETKNIVQFALLFGTTWFVNALVFAGILLSVLAAIEVARRFKLPRPGRLYALLFASLGVAFVVPPSALLELGLPVRFGAATLLAFTPIFIANVVFAQRFKDTASSTAAFGANLIGAMVGGVLEYASLLIGYRSLLIVTAILYFGAYRFGRKHLGRIPARMPAASHQSKAGRLASR